MVNNKSEALDRVFHALSDPTRRAILARTAEQECTVGELAAPFRMSLVAVSKHIKVLEDAGLLNRTVDGRVHRCKANVKPLQTVSDFVSHYQKYWTQQLDALEQYLQSQKKRGSK